MTETEDTKQQKTEELTDEALDDAQGRQLASAGPEDRQVHQQEVPRLRECGDQEHLAERLCRSVAPPEAAVGPEARAQWLDVLT